MALLLGIDIGTSSTKAVITDESGAVLAAASASHPISRPRPGWSEQDPEDWWASSKQAIDAALDQARKAHADIGAVGLSGQMHGSVFLDAETAASGGTLGRAVRPALLWNDQRTAAQCDAIEQAAGGRRRLIELVGNAALTGFTLPKILWVRETEPDNWAKVARIMLPKDYLAFRLTGEIAGDVGDGTGALLLNPERRDWSDEMLAAINLDRALLPPVHESATVVGRITPWASQQTGLPAGLPVAIGSGDNQTGAVGAGVVEPGLLMCALGTSGVIYAHADKPARDIPPDESVPAGRLHTMCAATGADNAPGAWALTGVMLSAAGSLQWARDLLAPDAEFSDLMDQAAKIEPGCEGLAFLPYLDGERCPHPDPGARGAWIGLTSRHTRDHLIRAVVEGVTFNLASILAIVRSLDVPVNTIRVGGGGAKSPFWRQMLADVFRAPIATTNTEEGPAHGAALIAGAATGAFASVPEACRSAIAESSLTEPGSQPASADAYAEARARFDRLFPAVRPAL